MTQPDSVQRSTFLRKAVLIVLILLGIAGAVVSVYGYRGRAANRLLRERLAEYRRRGEPVALSDFQPPAVDDADNAALDFQAAAALLHEESQVAKDAAEIDRELPWTAEELAKVQALLAESTPVLERVRAAAGKKSANWGFAVGSAPFFFDMRELAPQRGLANRLALAALEAHLRGDDDTAVRHVRELLHVGRAVDQMPGGVVSHLVTCGCRGLACLVVRQIAPDLLVGGPRVGTAKPEAVVGLVRDLLDDQPLTDGQRKALLCERATMVATFDGVLDGTIRASDAPGVPRIQALFLRPRWLTDSRLFAEYMTDVADCASKAGNLPGALANPNHFADELNRHPESHSQLAAILMPSIDRAIETHFRSLTEAHATAAVLAIRLYAVAHDGKLPRGLNDLVPQYLPALPTDAMAAGAPLLRFIAHESDPKVYSVGKNGKDDGGSELPDPPRLSPDPDLGPWQKQDAVFHYLRPARKAPKQEEPGGVQKAVEP